MNKADFFLIGAAKAGTTSLYMHLKQHPDIYTSPVKEPNYFSTDIQPAHFSKTYRKNTFLNTNRYFAQKHLPELQLTFVRNPKHYQMLFEAAAEYQRKGEGSTSYLYSEVAAANIYAYNPRAKIIAILRNPLERAYSHYLMALKYGHVREDFQTELEKDFNRKTKGWGISELFVELGLYYEQLKRYFMHFSSEQILVLLFEEFRHSPESTLAKCHEFLQVPKLQAAGDHIANEGRVPRAAGFNKLLVDTGLKSVVKALTPNRLQEKLKAIAYTAKRPAPDARSLEMLRSLYQEDIEKTSTLIQRDLSHWLQ